MNLAPGCAIYLNGKYPLFHKVQAQLEDLINRNHAKTLWKKLQAWLTKIVLAESHGSGYYPSNNPWEHFKDWLHE